MISRIITTRDVAHGRFLQVAQREPQPLELVRLETGEHVGLVLARVGRGAEQRAGAVALDARVVPGGKAGGAQPRCEVQHALEAHEAVAAHARVGRPGLRVLFDEVVHHFLLERIAQVESHVRKSHPVRERAGAGDRLGRAAAALAVVLGMRPQLERDGNYLMSRVER